LDWLRPVTVIYGDGAPPLELETAIAIAETLESASGRQVDCFQVSDVPPYALTNRSLVVVGSGKSNELIAKWNSRPDASPPNTLMITGPDSEAVEKAGMNFILSYWKNAKDSAAGRVGLAAKQLPRGGDATKLP
jgi:hypothetical protein